MHFCERPDLVISKQNRLAELRNDFLPVDKDFILPRIKHELVKCTTRMWCFLETTNMSVTSFFQIGKRQNCQKVLQNFSYFLSKLAQEHFLVK